jgi:DNA (cytosine-5)-methyltransferase 1
MPPIKIIDLFAGPGGLGEGFSQLKVNGQPAFEIICSIEKEKAAHATLTLRAFVRKFGDNIPNEYYEFLKGNLGATPDEQLYKIPKFQTQLAAARKEALNLTLGEDNDKIYSAINAELSANEDCVLIGGPPCQAYSLAGKARQAGYDANKDHRNFLYLEYLKVIAKFQPKVFVMENVKGMLSAKVAGEPIFDSIMEDLKHPSNSCSEQPVKGRKDHKYKVFSLAVGRRNAPLSPRDYVIHAEDYGVPQRRHRVILVGVRADVAKDLKEVPLLAKSQVQVPVEEVLADLPKLRSGLSKELNTVENWLASVRTNPPNVSQELGELGRQNVAQEMERQRKSFKPFEYDQGAMFGLEKPYAPEIPSNVELESWYNDPMMGGHLTNHQTRGHLVSDLQRYYFSSVWAQVNAKNKDSVPFPKSSEYPDSLKPAHKNFDSGKFTDRFRVQLANTPATTITSHISKDGHYFIHYDPTQARSLTVREAARIQTFPDNYFFVGNRTSQYVQVGNAVPPFLAKQIADVAYKVVSYSANSKPSL